jgi:hypothetical protein
MCARPSIPKRPSQHDVRLHQHTVVEMIGVLEMSVWAAWLSRTTDIG